MTKNIDDSERIVRVISGAIITSLAFWGPENYWFLLGIIPVVTGFVGFCPAYSIFGTGTRTNKLN